MSDAASRQLLREWRARPGDQGVLAQLVSALEREGEPLPTEVIEARRTPARFFESTFELEVHVQPPEEGEAPRLIGTTPGSVEVPEARYWWVRPRPVALTKQLALDLAKRSVTGLSLAAGKIDLGQQLDDLDDLPELKHLGLSSCSGVGDDCLERIARCTSLESLDLSGRKRFRRRGLEAIAELPRLTRLNLSRCVQLLAVDLPALGSFRRLAHLGLASNESRGPWLSALEGLEELRSLDLSAARNLSGKGFRSLPPLPNLVHLDVKETGVTSPGLTALRRTPNLRSLELEGPYRAKSLEVLAELSELRKLVFTGDPELRGVARVIGRLEALRHLTLTRGFGSDWAEAQPCLDSLDSLQLYLARPQDVSLASSCRSLRRLVLRNYPFTQSELEPLRGLPKLEHLEIASSPPSASMGIITSLQNLDSLTLELPFARRADREVHHELAELVALPSLRRLTLGRATLSAELMRSLGPLELETLDLWSCHFESGVWSVLSGWPSLRSLKLSFLSETESSTHASRMSHLSKCGGLEELEIEAFGPQAGDCEPFADFNNLKRLTLHLSGSARVTSAQLRNLRSALPRCAVRVTRS